MVHKGQKIELNLGLNQEFIENLYEEYLENSGDLNPSWRDFFQGIENDRDHEVKREKGEAIIDIYRRFGHSQAQLDPLGMSKIKAIAELDWGVEAKYEAERKAYTGTVGYEFMHLEEREERAWWQENIENNLDIGASLSSAEKKEALFTMLRTVTLEQYLHHKFPGMKRFSIEGGEAAIAAVQRIIKLLGNHHGCREVVIGMPHRGRLAMITQIVGRPERDILARCLEVMPLEGEGRQWDVKYHVGAYGEMRLEGNGLVKVAIPSNPSHLESINPVIMGNVRAKQDKLLKSGWPGDVRKAVVPLLQHGDASFAGQGIVMESMALGTLAAYEVGGTIHLVINNQVGFTTGPEQSRGTRYSTAIAKMVDAPIIHVNGNDIEGVLWAAGLAAEYRSKFHKDVVLEIVCYRKYGHNEGDEPIFTQPALYKTIQGPNWLTPTQRYRAELVNKGIISQEESDQAQKNYEMKLEQEQSLIEQRQAIPNGVKLDHIEKKLEIEITTEKLKQLGAKIFEVPQGFLVNGKIERQLQAKKKMLETGEGIDWATGEALAYASILEASYSIRFTGQDVERGTFAQRHAVLIDQNDERSYIPLNNLGEGAGKFAIYNSNLSEFAVLGFEYGYSLAHTEGLTIWEAQFGDFANGAQIIIDQYIAGGGTKWGNKSNIVVLLPHGYEGQGPEHSSARLERFLQLCAENNMTVANCTTPASFFHLLKDQVKKLNPLIIMTPKSLLRHRSAISSLAEMGEGQKFRPVIIDEASSNEPRKIIFCSGKIYYDLREGIQQSGKGSEILLVRIERLYPFPYEEITRLLSKFRNSEVAWVQEEPANMGAYIFVKEYFEQAMVEVGKKDIKLNYVGRPAAASPAVGFAKKHVIEQQKIVEESLK